MIRETIDILTQGKADAALVHHLEDAVKQHPYSSAMHVLLARAAYLTESPKFEEFVRDAAIRTQNRKQLHHFVFTEIAKEESEVESSIEVIETETLLLPEVNIPAKQETTESETIEEVIEEVSETEIEEIEVEETNSTTDVEEEQEEVKTESKAEPFDIDSARIEALEKQFLSEMLAAGGAIELLSTDEPMEEETNLAQKIRQQNTSDEIAPSAEQGEVEETHDAEESVEVEQKPTVEPEKLSLSGWLQFLDENEVEPEINEVQTEASRPEPTIVKDVKEVSDIISNFIQNESQIVPKRAEFYSPAKAAKNSLMDKEDYVTETLANVYAAQGSISKAISTYEKLSLLHPEKSAYFAALIKKLKRQL